MVGFLAYPWSSTAEFNMCKQAHSVLIFANSHDMLLLKFDLLNSLTMLQDAMYMYLQVYCCAVCICYGINSGANIRDMQQQQFVAFVH